MKLYLIRHGQTDWNLAQKIQGQTDIPLNNTGILQAEKMRDKLKNYQFDKCYVSPLKRAKQTAEIITDGQMELIFDDNLKERGFGSLEGGDPGKWYRESLDRRLNMTKGGMESIFEVLERSKKVLQRIKSENPDDAKILVVSHGVLLKTMHFNIVGYDDNTDFWELHFENGDLMEYDI